MKKPGVHLQKTMAVLLIVTCLLSCLTGLTSSAQESGGKTVISQHGIVAATDGVKLPGSLVPSFEVEPGLTVEVGEEVYFNAQSTAYPDQDLLRKARFEWDFGDGYVFKYGAPRASDRNSGNAVIHHFMKPGKYSVTLTVSVFEYNDTTAVEPAIEIQTFSKEITVSGEAPMQGFELLCAPFGSRLAQFITAKIPEAVTANAQNSLVVTLQFNNESPVVIHQKNTLESEEKFLMDQRNLKQGDYRLTAELRDSNNNVLSRWVEKFNKAINGIPKVGINEWNAVCIDGTPSFIITPYMLDLGNFSKWEDAVNATFVVGYYPNSPHHTVSDWTDYLTFSDIRGDEWYAAYIPLSVYRIFIKGFPDGTFKGSNLVTRAEVLTMLARFNSSEAMIKQKAEQDTESWIRFAEQIGNGWYTHYMVSAKDGMLHPEQYTRELLLKPMTRGEVIYALANFLCHEDIQEGGRYHNMAVINEKPAFKDTLKTIYIQGSEGTGANKPNWFALLASAAEKPENGVPMDFYPSIMCLKDKGILLGNNGDSKWQDHISRAEVLALFERLAMVW